MKKGKTLKIGVNNEDLLNDDLDPQTWSRYPDESQAATSTPNLDSLGFDFAKLLTESRDLSKAVLKSHPTSQIKSESSGLDDLLKLDFCKLTLALECMPFYVNLFPECESYFDKDTRELFEKNLDEQTKRFSERYGQDDLMLRRMVSVTASEKVIESSADSLAPKCEIANEPPKSLTIDDWLDDLIN